MIKVLDISITDYCPNNCKYCSMEKWRQSDRASAKFINADRLKNYLEENKQDLIIVSGGQPTEHDEFSPIVELCLLHSKEVIVQCYEKGSGHKMKFIALGAEFKVSVVDPNAPYRFDALSREIHLPNKLLPRTVGCSYEISKEFYDNLHYRVMTPDFDTTRIGTCWNQNHVHSTIIPHCYEICLQVKVIEDLCKYLKLHRCNYASPQK